MQTVNFQCGHCGKLMAVGSEFLGQQVRCPHCQQVVVAPSPAPTNPIPTAVSAPPPAPDLGETVLHTPTPPENHEDIFSPTEPSDDLFGHPNPPRLELPADPPAPALTEHPAPPPPEAAASTTAAYLPPESASPTGNGEGPAILPPQGGEAPWMAGTVTEMLPSSAAEAPPGHEHESLADAALPSAPRPKRRAESGTPWFLILVFSPLLLYSIVITIFAVMLYMHQREVEDNFRRRFELLPDEGDNPGVQKGKKVSRNRFTYKPEFATLPLPAHLITTLGEPLRVGDLQITPTHVERERVSVFVEHHERPEPCLGDSLVLYLKMKNLSSEYAFAPLDNYFDRYWKPGADQLPPFTQLEVGDKGRFYGGPAHWYPPPRGDKDPEREWVKGRKGFEPELLQPGEEKKFFVCTDGQDAQLVSLLFGVKNNEKVREPYHGSFLWRVRVRRGLASVNGKEYPTTAVLGVKFTDKNVTETH